MDYNSLLELAIQRRSVRKYKTNAVSRDDIEKIVQVAMQSPSGANWQPWDFVVIDDPVLKEQINTYLLDGIGTAKTAKGFTNAPVFILLYGDTRVRNYAPPTKTDDENWWNFTLNASLNNAFMAMQYAATSLGLGTMWVSAFRNPKVSQPVQKLLKIPSYYQVYEMLAIGYSDIKIAKKRLRNISDVLHYNTATNYRSEEDLEHWFHPHKSPKK